MSSKDCCLDLNDRHLNRNLRDPTKGTRQGAVIHRSHVTGLVQNPSGLG